MPQKEGFEDPLEIRPYFCFFNDCFLTCWVLSCYELGFLSFQFQFEDQVHDFSSLKEIFLGNRFFLSILDPENDFPDDFRLVK